MTSSGDETDREKGFVAYGLSEELRQAVQASFEQALQTAGPNFGHAMREMQATVARADSLALVGALAMYCATAKAGTNPEFNRPMGVFSHHIELVQAFAFGPRTEPEQGLHPPFLVIEDVVRAVRQLRTRAQIT